MLSVLRAVGTALVFLLKVLGIALAAVLLLIIAALLVPVSFKFRYHGGAFSASARILFLNIPLAPSKKSVVKKPKKKSEKKEPDVGTPRKRARKELDFGFISHMLPPAGRAARYVFRHIRLSELEGVFVIKGDPYTIGVNTGRAWQAVGGVMTLLQNVFGDVSYKALDIVPDFMSDVEEPSPTVGGVVTARGITAVCAGFILLKGYIKYTGNNRNIKSKKENAA